MYCIARHCSEAGTDDIWMCMGWTVCGSMSTSQVSWRIFWWKMFVAWGRELSWRERKGLWIEQLRWVWPTRRSNCWQYSGKVMQMLGGSNSISNTPFLSQQIDTMTFSNVAQPWLPFSGVHGVGITNLFAWNTSVQSLFQNLMTNEFSQVLVHLSDSTKMASWTRRLSAPSVSRWCNSFNSSNTKPTALKCSANN